MQPNKIFQSPSDIYLFLKTRIKHAHTQANKSMQERRKSNARWPLQPSVKKKIKKLPPVTKADINHDPLPLTSLESIQRP